MVDHLEVDDAGLVTVTVLLTVAGCPMKDTIDRDVTGARLGAVDGVTGVELTLGVMTAEQRAEPPGRPCAAARPSGRSPSPSPAR